MTPPDVSLRVQSVRMSRTATGGKFPVFFPGNGTTEPLTTYSGNEYPDPLQACPGYTAPTGLPVFVEVGGNVTATAGAHSLTGNGVALAHCVIDGSNAALGSYLNSRGGLIVIPRQPLVTGVQYMVNVTVNGVPYAWSFSVGPLAALPPPPAAVTATSTGTTATVTWTPSAGLAGTAPTSYTVTPYMAGVAQTPQVVMAPTTSATFSGLASWTDYRFAVSATSSLPESADRATSSASIVVSLTDSPMLRVELSIASIARTVFSADSASASVESATLRTLFAMSSIAIAVSSTNCASSSAFSETWLIEVAILVTEFEVD